MSTANIFEWRSDGWGVVRTDWGDASRLILTYLRRVREAAKEGELEELTELLHEQPAVRFAVGVIRDLVAIGWQLKVPSSGQVLIRPPESPDLSADAVRAIQMRSRSDQLRQPSVRKFIASLEKKTLGPKGWHSIFSLMRDGKELSTRLRKVATAEDLNSVIDPYIQVADPKGYCEKTGLNLYDAWRYFRHTWVTPYQSVPGRSLSLLVRDAASPNHPVIGIAALGSAVVHSTARDFLIGWQGDTVVEDMVANPNRRWAEWLLKSLSRLFDSIYVIDLIADGTLRQIDLRRPDDLLIATLDEESFRCKERHRKDPNSARVSQAAVNSEGGVDWRLLTQSHLYRSKRCKFLAHFLRIRKVFIESGFTSPTPKALRRALESGAFRDCVRSLVARVKAERVGIDMMDITVCGAIPPYTHLLGGKLVCMILTSPEVQRIYEARYGSSPSIIASGIRGEEVVRQPRLVCLSTTSLYGRNSSQYNRVRIPGSAVGGKSGHDVVYQRGGDGAELTSHRSEGFGTFHFRKSTLVALDEWIEYQVETNKDKSMKDVNYIFGEGTSPKLRKLRKCISDIGLPGDEALKHDRSRIVYYIALASNVRDFLLGLESTPRWIFPDSKPQVVTRKIATHWTRRWLAMRIKSADVLSALAGHTLAYPITHGARVVLPDIAGEEAEFEFDA